MKDKISEIRDVFNNHGTVFPKSNDIKIEQRFIENVNCFLFSKINCAESKELIIYLHGGAFTLGGIKSHTPLVSHYVDKFNIPILFIEYSLAPENPYPIAINEVVNVYQSLLQKNIASNIIFMGDSAGGGLAISVISKLNENKIAIPKSLIMISPWTDLTCSFESHSSNAAHDPIFGGKTSLLQGMAILYAGDKKVKEVSPLELMFGTFPPTLILVGSTEVLLDDSIAIYEKIKSNRANVKLSIYNNQKHVWTFEDIYAEDSQKALTEIHEFIMENKNCH